MTLFNAWTVLPSNGDFIKLVVSGTIDHFLDDRLIPNLEEEMLNTVLNTPKI